MGFGIEFLFDYKRFSWEIVRLACLGIHIQRRLKNQRNDELQALDF